MTMDKPKIIKLLKEIEKDIYVSSLESTFLQDAKSCAIHEAIEMLQAEPSVQPKTKCIAKITMTEEQVKEAFEKAKCEILATQLEQGWIPCKERLPEEFKTVLVTGKMKYEFEKEYEYFTDCAFVRYIHGTRNNFNPFDFETWNDWYEGQEEYYILAWMPLPEHYKEEGE